ncbi:MAG TPA: DUF6452 family protein [Ohtaekwangia sp.]
MKKASWFVILLFAVSCLDDPDCFQLNNNIIGISFRVLGSTKPDTLLVVGVEMSGTDSIFLEPAKYINAALPLNFTTSSTNVIFHQLGGLSNSMNLGYLARTQFVSDDCGSRFVLSDLQILGSDFDSVRVLDPQPDKVARNNIEVYRCPEPYFLTVVFRDLYLNSAGDEAKRTGGIKLSGINDSYSSTTYYEDAALATFYLPVDTLSDQTTFDFIQPDGTTNQLTVQYTRTYQKRYNPCDPKTFVTGLSIVDAESDFVLSEMVLDSEGEEKSTLTDPPEANVYVYRCPRTNLVKIDFKERVPNTSSSVRTDTVFLKSVRVNYTPQILYDNTLATTITVPIDETAQTTDVYLEYETRTDTLRLSYTAHPSRVFISETADCGAQGIYSNLELTETITGVTVKADSLRFPVVSNIEIIN